MALRDIPGSLDLTDRSNSAAFDANDCFLDGLERLFQGLVKPLFRSLLCERVQQVSGQWVSVVLTGAIAGRRGDHPALASTRPRGRISRYPWLYAASAVRSASLSVLVLHARFTVFL